MSAIPASSLSIGVFADQIHILLDVLNETGFLGLTGAAAY
jgi:hypothetical protein